MESLFSGSSFIYVYAVFAVPIRQKEQNLKKSGEQITFSLHFCPCGFKFEG